MAGCLACGVCGWGGCWRQVGLVGLGNVCCVSQHPGMGALEPFLSPARWHWEPCYVLPVPPDTQRGTPLCQDRTPQLSWTWNRAHRGLCIAHQPFSTVSWCVAWELTSHTQHLLCWELVLYVYAMWEPVPHVLTCCTRSHCIACVSLGTGVL